MVALRQCFSSFLEPLARALSTPLQGIRADRPPPPATFSRSLLLAQQQALTPRSHPQPKTDRRLLWAGGSCSLGHVRHFSNRSWAVPPKVLAGQVTDPSDEVVRRRQASRQPGARGAWRLLARTLGPGA
jgi:hypothetical protein